MPQSLVNNLMHIIYSTKDRYPYLQDDCRKELHAYAATIFQRMESQAIVINSVTDHMHVLCRLSKNRALCDVVQEVKCSTSKWLKTKGGILTKFGWQNGYGGFSVSPSKVASTVQYIDEQEDHHRKVSFQEEFRSFLTKYEIEFDERYVWD